MKRFQDILVAVDTRFDEHPALQCAIQLAKHNQAKLKIVDVLPELPWVAKLALPDTEGTQEALAEQKIHKLETIAQSVRDQQIDARTQLLYNKSSVAIIEEVTRSGHDLVLRATKGAHSGRTGFFGTTSMRLLRGCPCAVWLVRADAVPKFERVMVAIDPAPRDATREVMNASIVDLGKSIAEYEDGQLHIVHAWEFFGEQVLKSRYKPDELEEAKRGIEAQVAKALDKFLSRYNLTHQDDNVHLLRDPKGAGHAISALAEREQIDLVIMGTMARSGLKGALIGNTAEQVLDRIQCSVLALKPQGFTSPATTSD